MNKRLKIILWIIAIALISVPISLFVTFLLIPLWAWVEAKTEIESIGHSGPAEWCFVLVYAFFIFVSLAAYWRRYGMRQIEDKT